MSDVVIVPANVIAWRPYKLLHGRISGSNVVAGQLLYFFADPINGRGWDLTSALPDPDPARSGVAGCAMALTRGSPNQPVVLLEQGSVLLGPVLVKGQTYVLSAGTTEGSICPLADLLPGDYVTIVGVAESTSLLRLPDGGIDATGETR